MNNGKYKTHPLMIIPRTFWNFMYRQQIKNRKVSKKKIAVVLHLFYLDSWREIKSFLKNLEKYDYDLYITADMNRVPDSVKDKIQSFKSGTVFFDSKNKGFDVGPFVLLLDRVDLKQYDIVIKLQSKGTRRGIRLVGNTIFFGRQWFLSLISSIMGPRNIHLTIRKLSKQEVGMIGSSDLIISETYDKIFVRNILKKYNIAIPDDYQYVAGTCFAIRSSLLKKIKSLKLNEGDFVVSEPGHYSLAHALERYFGIIVGEEKLKIEGNNTFSIRKIEYSRAERLLKRTSCIRVLEETDFKIDPDAAVRALNAHYMDDYKITKVRASDLLVGEKDKIRKISASQAYKCIKNENIKKFGEYCRDYKRDNYLTLTMNDFRAITNDNHMKKLRALKKSLRKGYDNNQPIIVDQNGLIMDGVKRACILLSENKDVIIPAIKIQYRPYNIESIKPFSKRIKIR